MSTPDGQPKKMTVLGAAFLGVGAMVGATFTAMIVLGELAVVLDLVWKRVRPAPPLAPATPGAP